MGSHPLNVRRYLSRFPAVKIAAYVLNDLLWGLRHLYSSNVRKSRASTGLPDVQESAERAFAFFTLYKKYGKIAHFTGKVAEIGPGSNAGVALLVRNDGADSVDLIDRFLWEQDPEVRSAFYTRLRELCSGQDISCAWSGEAGADSWKGIQWQVGMSAERYFSRDVRQDSETYDFILSSSVLEHLMSPLTSLEAMIHHLRPGGTMIHFIDYRDHGMFSLSQHELYFLEIPRFLYPLLVRNSARPNRVLHHEYRRLLERLRRTGLIDCELLVTGLYALGELKEYQAYEAVPAPLKKPGIEYVASHRSRFASEFREVSSEDLSVSGSALIVRKK